VLKLREQYPRWGKDKLAVLLHREGLGISTSMVGRIMRRLKERGILREPVGNGISARKRPRQRPYAVRKPKEYQAREPGDIVEVDTLDVRPLPGVVLKHFTARDVVSRYDVLEVHRQAKATTAAHFLDRLLCDMPFTIRALQVDGGSEFEAEFEVECQQHGLLLFVLPSRSPKLNGSVERAQRTRTEEFYEIYDGDFEIQPLNKALKEWQFVYNHIRPHQALDYLTPAEFIEEKGFKSGPGVVLSGSANGVPSTTQKERRDVYGMY
jgi:transposase InsO family protein